MVGERNTWLAAKGYVYRIVDHSQNEYSQRMVAISIVLERFWGYLKRKLAVKGGIRREKLPFYLGEYVWRYNHRKLFLKEQENRLFNLIFQYFPKLF